MGSQRVGHHWVTEQNTQLFTLYVVLQQKLILLRVPWTARRSKEINSEYSLAGLMLKLKLQYFDHLMQRADSFEKTLMLGKIEDRRRRGRQRMRWLDASPTQWA